MVERTLVSMLVTSALACSAAQAQTPNPPILMGGELPPTSPGKIIFSDGFEEHDLGQAADISNWKVAKSGSTATLTIEDKNPLCAECGKYLRTFATKKDQTVYRVEYAYAGEPSNDEMVSLGGGDYRGSQTYWYGYLMSLDQYPANDERIHLIQMWMKLGPPPQDQATNPQVSLMANAEGYRVNIEDNDDLNGNFKTAIGPNSLFGKCKQYIFKVNADTRTIAEGSTGELGIWVDGVSIYSHVNKQTMQDKQAGLHHDFRIGGYLSGWRFEPSSENGQAYEARWDNWTVMDGTGSLAAMQQAVGTCN
ncbi:MAG: hypothetical protein WD647_10645 [Steroidobacteraceae bacterium]